LQFPDGNEVLLKEEKRLLAELIREALQFPDGNEVLLKKIEEEIEQLRAKKNVAVP